MQLLNHIPERPRWPYEVTEKSSSSLVRVVMYYCTYARLTCGIRRPVHTPPRRGPTGPARPENGRDAEDASRNAAGTPPGRR